MIFFDEKKQIWKLDTPNTSYILGVVDGKYLAHLYYGAKVADTDLSYLLRLSEGSGVPSKNPAESVGFMDGLPFEYPVSGRGDFRESCISVRNAAGQEGLELCYVDCEIVQEKEPLQGLPASFGENVNTLKIRLSDEVLHLSVILSYSVFEDVDVITRSVLVCNDGEQELFLTRALSACLEIENENFEVLSFTGSWSREHIPERQKLLHSAVTAESFRGVGGHDGQPFLALVSENATEDAGKVYAMHLIYSGNFYGKAKCNPHEQVRMVLGIQPEGFCCKLEPGETFCTPEAVMTFSGQGISGMTHTLHDFYRQHLIRSKWKFAERPVLINSWEAVYFDFTTEKLLEIVKEAAMAGIDLFVLDDGWFGKNRNQPSGALGDWFCNEEKLPGGLKRLSEEIKKQGMLFGLWFEPEMISEDSCLYREHPEWVLHTKDRRPGLCRDQWMLDFSNPAVIDYLYEKMEKVIDEAGLSYIKWDMNRGICDVGSEYLPADRQGELLHRHVLGVYELQERLIERFPELLIENCSSGGARFDPGMLYYSPQIWCSDDMDPVERLSIHEGTAMIYPISCIGSHVCKSPNDITGREVPFATRGIQAMMGTFGYELDITKISEEEKRAIPEQIKAYRGIQKLVQEGDYWRLASYRENGLYNVYMVVSKDKKSAYVIYMQVLARPNTKSRRVFFKGLDKNQLYQVSDGEKTECFRGDVLMQAGYLFPHRQRDFVSVFLRLEAVEDEI